jgi:hypothetical protein
MAVFEDHNSVFQRLDQFIEDNLEVEIEMGLHAFPNRGEDGRKKKLDNFIKEMIGKGDREKEMFFADILEKMRIDLNLNPPDVYKPALITRDCWAKWMGSDRPRPERPRVIAIGCSLIQADVKKNGSPVLPPQERMNELLFSAGGADYILKHGSKFDLTIMFCLNENIFDVLEVNELLAYEKQPLLPDGKKADVGTDA